MHIKSGTIYNKNNENYEGFVIHGDDISVFDPEKIATEALVFMIVSLQSHWKVPVGYVLSNSINATNLACFISKALHLASSQGLEILCITCDGTSTNLHTHIHTYIHLLFVKAGYLKTQLLS